MGLTLVIKVCWTNLIIMSCCYIVRWNNLQTSFHHANIDMTEYNVDLVKNLTPKEFQHEMSAYYVNCK